MSLRQEKVKSLIGQVVSRFLSENSNKTSLITVTAVSVSSDLKKATLFVSVFPEDKEKEALDFLKRKRREAKQFLKINMHSKIIPFLDFEIDKGEKNRQRLDELPNNHQESWLDD